MYMYKFFLLPLDISIGTYGGGGVARAASDGGSSIIETFVSVFTSMFNVITENPALLAILCVAVGAPILGVVISLFKGR